MACLTRVEVISPLSTMFWIREALVVPDDLHAIVICIDKSVDDAGGDEGIWTPPESVQ